MDHFSLPWAHGLQTPVRCWRYFCCRGPWPLLWAFHKWGGPRHGWFMGQNLIRIVDLGVPPFQETSRWPRQDIFPTIDGEPRSNLTGFQCWGRGLCWVVTNIWKIEPTCTEIPSTFLSMHNYKMNILYCIDLLYAHTCYLCYLHPLQLRVLLLPLRDHASECLRDLHKDNLCVKEVFPFQEC